jgi:hypothetical protein
MKQEISLDTIFEETSKFKRGPRKALSDPQLQNRRDQLLQLFEGDWGRLGLELKHCNKPEDLIRAFLPFQNTYASEAISAFCRPSDEAASTSELKRIRRELRMLVVPSYDVDESKRRIREQLQEIELAKTTKKNRRIVVQEQRKQRKEAGKTEQKRRVLSAQERELRNRLEKLEASFARQELLLFIRSGRYELAPLSLANAIGNLPFSGWRQSMKRTTKSRSKIGGGLSFRIFKALRFLSESAHKQSDNNLVSFFRMRIPSLPSRHKLARIELANNWFFLERAIRQSHKKMKDPTVRHFAITDLYFKNLHSATQVERVVARHKKIVFPNKAAGSTVPT